MGFAVYASLIPFAFHAIAFDEAVVRFADLVRRIPTAGAFSRSDAVANALLFVPVGFFLSGTFRLGARTRWSGPMTTVGILALSLSLSVLVEFLQIFTPDRNSSSRDIVAQFGGALIGNVLWEALGHDLSIWVQTTLESQTRRQRLERLLLAYAGVWLLFTLAPFDFTLDVGELARKARTGGLVLDPFGRPQDTPLDRVWDAFKNVIGAVPLGILAMVLTRRVVPALALVGAAVGGVEALQFLVASRVADVADVVWGGVGAALGALAGAKGSRRVAGQPSDTSGWVPALLLAAWCLAMAAYHWMPFNFTADSVAVREKLGGLSLIPFAGYHRGPDLNSLDQLLIKLGLSLPVGVLSGFLAPAGRLGRRLWMAGWLVFVGVLFTVVEAGQLFLPTRHPDPSDVLVATVGSAVGLALTLWLRQPPA